MKRHSQLFCEVRVFGKVQSISWIVCAFFKVGVIRSPFLTKDIKPFLGLFRGVMPVIAAKDFSKIFG